SGSGETASSAGSASCTPGATRAAMRSRLRVAACASRKETCEIAAACSTECSARQHSMGQECGILALPHESSSTIPPMKRVLMAVCSLLLAAYSYAADYPQPTAGDFIIRNFKFASGETLPELRIHYRTLGSPQKDAHGRVRNAVLILHGTTGSGE